MNTLDRPISFKSLLAFSLPSIIMMIFLNVYSMIDGIFVSQLINTNALSAINIITPILTTAIAFATMFGTGGNAIVSRKMGEGKTEEARRDFSTLTFLIIITGILLTAVCFFFLDELLILLGASESNYQYCLDYMRVTAPFLTSCMLSIAFQIYLVTAGKSGLSMLFTILGGITNIILDYVFISLLGMGIEGAALATGIGYSATGLLGLAYFIWNRKNDLYLVRPQTNFALMKESSLNGSSEMVSTMSNGIITLLLNNILMRFAGVDGVAAITVILYIQLLLNAVFLGYSVGISPLVGFNYGKKDSKRLKKIYRISITTTLVFSILVCTFGFVYADFLIAIFTGRTSNVFDIAFDGLRIYSLSYLFVGINIFSSGFFTALSNGKVSALLSFLRTLVILVICMIVLPEFLGLTGVWLSVPVAELLSLLLSIYYLRKYKNVYQYA